MIRYTLSPAYRTLREAATTALSPRVTISRTRYLVRVDGVLHHVRRDGVCDCGGHPQAPCPALPLIRDYLARGGAKPLGRHPDTWPASWSRVPPLCPVCDCPTVADRHLDSSHGPGWRCTLDAGHYWQVRMEPLRRYLRAHPLPPRYPWYDTSEEERQAWLDAHYHPPRLAPSTEGEKDYALDRENESAGQHRPGVTSPWLAIVWLSRGPERPDDRLLRSGVMGRDR